MRWNHIFFDPKIIAILWVMCTYFRSRTKFVVLERVCMLTPLDLVNTASQSGHTTTEPISSTPVYTDFYSTRLSCPLSMLHGHCYKDSMRASRLASLREFWCYNQIFKPTNILMTSCRHIFESPPP